MTAGRRVLRNHCYHEYKEEQESVALLIPFVPHCNFCLPQGRHGMLYVHTHNNRQLSCSAVFDLHKLTEFTKRTFVQHKKRRS